MAKMAFRSDRLGRSTKNNSSKRPLRISSGGREFTLLQVAATNTGAFRSWVQERNDASRRDETPASTEAESGPLPANTFSSSSIHSTHGANPSATLKTFWMRFSVSPMYLSYTAAVSNFTNGNIHSPATARAQRLFPQPWTPSMITPLGGS